MRTRYLEPPIDVTSNVGFIPNYVIESFIDENGVESNDVRQLSDEEYIEKLRVPSPSGLFVNGVKFNPDNLSKLQAIDELERRVDNMEIKES